MKHYATTDRMTGEVIVVQADDLPSAARIVFERRLAAFLEQSKAYAKDTELRGLVVNVDVAEVAVWKAPPEWHTTGQHIDINLTGQVPQ